MPNWIRYITLSIIILILKPSIGIAQYYLFKNNEPINVDISFLKHSIEAFPKQSFFNVLKVVNRSNRTETFTLNFTTPQGWQVIGLSQQEITIAPLDSMIIPLRVSIGSRVRGDIGYSVIASISDNRGNTFKNEYCFVKIPRQKNLKIKILSRNEFLDQRTNMSKFIIGINNQGNREELVSFLFESDPQLGVGPADQNQYSSEIVVPPFSDTTVTYTVKLTEKSELEKKNFKVNSKISTVDTSYSSTIWFQKLDSKFVNFIPFTQKPLVAELYLQGVLQGEKKPNVTAFLTGDVLLKKNNDVYFYYRNFSSSKEENWYKYNRMYIGTNINKFQVEVGDIYRNIEGANLGRGAFLAYNGNPLTIEFLGSKNQRIEEYNLGTQILLKANNNLSFRTGFTYNKNTYQSYESKLFLVGSNFALAKKHRFNTLFSYNLLSQSIDNVNQHKEFGSLLGYNSTLGPVKTQILFRYGSQFYIGQNRGRINVNLVSTYTINPFHKLIVKYFVSQDNSTKIESDTISSDITNIKSIYRLEYGYTVNPSIYLYAGPAIEDGGWKNSPPNTPEYNFKVRNYQGIFGVRVRLGSQSTTLNTQILLSKSYVTDYPNKPYFEGQIYLPDTVVGNRDVFSYKYLTLSLRTKKWGIFGAFTSGPKTIFEQQNYFFNSRQTRHIRFMPFWESFVYKNILLLSANISYNNDLIAHSSYLNITGQAYWYLPKDWRLHLLGVYSLQHRTDQKESLLSYQTLYFEVGIRKEFNFQQPRVKYHNVTLIFFKDFNGNHIQESNEPGIKNVLVALSREQDRTQGNIPGEVTSIELLSDNLGIVSLEKIPNGLYTIDFNPVGQDAGSFSKALDQLTLNVDKNNIFYIPFTEKNKVFGKIILNRSRLSGLGKLDLSNVRVTATDSKGRTYSALTDKNGDFVLYAPITDQYTVNINNIFYENFDLRQNSFKVQFNGYKQFEVNFVFDEKIRRINFSPSTQDNQLANVLQIRRTNLRGYVKDANSLTPIRSRVNLVNTKTNTVLSSMYSSSQTGEYNIAFMADDNYLLEVLADGYWYHSENLNLNQVTTFLNVTKDIMLKPISIGSKIELNIQFDINKTELKPEAVAELNRLLRLLKDNENIKIEVQGHSDDLETLSNAQISEDRAKKVARYLIENGFSNLQIRGFGNTVPIASNDTEQGRSLNRRVEIEVVSK